jgi:ankyrin repeat protein/tetratricopeptide (TPR) repeat protein
MQYAREVIFKSTITQQAVELAARSPGPVWMATLEAIRKDRSSKPTDKGSKSPSQATDELAHIVAQTGLQECDGSDSDDDLETDFAKAALSTGTHAFEAQDWEEADSLLQEGLRILQQLPKERRSFCDTFSLHYKLAICAYHTQKPTAAEEALNSLVQQSANNNERECIYNATYLLSQLYIRMGQIERARVECEKALQGRRRLLGKQSDASLESMALMAHIYFLLNNRALAKSCLAMIPETRRDAVLERVEESLGTTVEHLDFSSLLSRVPAAECGRSRLSASTLSAPPSVQCDSGADSVISKSPAASPWQTPTSLASEGTTTEDMQSFLKRSPPSAEERKEWGLIEKERPTQRYSSDTRKTDPTLPGSDTLLEATESSKGKTLSRKEILSKVGCQPRDRTEEAVCDGDHAALTTILHKKKGFWRSSVRKRGRPERVTALHFAALFGEVDMARRLVEAKFDVNEIPFGYSTTLTPLNFAIGARQVAMVDFLTANGAKPAEPDTWSTLAAQLMGRSWLVKTMSESERVLVPDRIVAIMKILLRHGWLINAPIGASGNTILHQAVSFWTGAYTWDLSLRGVVTSFLCERGADPFQSNTEGKTPYDMASASGHQDLVSILEHCSKRKELSGASIMPAELPGFVQ